MSVGALCAVAGAGGRLFTLALVCSRPDPSACTRPEPARFGGRLPERLALSRCRLRGHRQGHAGGLLRQMLRQRAKCEAEPGGAALLALAASARGRSSASRTLRALLPASPPSVSSQLTCLLSLFFPSLRLPSKRDRAVKPRSSQQSQTQCWRSGCSNVSPGCTDLCPECHTRGQAREVGRRAQAPKEKSKQRCRTQGCDHYANQEKQGYCNECDHFKQIYRG